MVMKLIKYLIFLPVFAFADSLSPQEIDKLVEHAFYSDNGYNSKNFSRWNKPIHLFVNPFWNGTSGDRTEPTRRELDEIKKVTDDITQLTGIQYTIHEEPLTLEEARSYVMNNPKVGSVKLYFVPHNRYMTSGMKAEGTFARNSARIRINTQYRKSNGQDLEFVIHNIREELTNAIGLPGDTYNRVDKFSALEGVSEHFGHEFSLMDRRNIYAYYAMDKGSGHEYPPSYTEAEFRERIAKVEINDEIVNGGRFEGMVDPEFTSQEQFYIDNPHYLSIEEREKSDLPLPKGNLLAETKEEKDPEPTLEPEEETKEEVQEKAEQAALDADWLYFKHYPWVYSSKTGSWYYLVPRNEGMIVWSQLSNQWQMMSDAFGMN